MKLRADDHEEQVTREEFEDIKQTITTPYKLCECLRPAPTQGKFGKWCLQCFGQLPEREEEL